MGRLTTIKLQGIHLVQPLLRPNKNYIYQIGTSSSLASGCGCRCWTLLSAFCMQRSGHATDLHIGAHIAILVAVINCYRMSEVCTIAFEIRFLLVSTLLRNIDIIHIVSRPTNHNSFDCFCPYTNIRSTSNGGFRRPGSEPGPREKDPQMIEHVCVWGFLDGSRGLRL